MSIVETLDFTTTYTKAEMASTPNVALWCPCDETGTPTTLTDAVSAATFSGFTSAALAGGISIPSDNAIPFSGALPTLSGSFALMVVLNPNASATAFSFTLGDVTPHLLLSNGGSNIIGASGTASLGNITITSGIKKYLILSDVENSSAALYQSAINAALVKGTPSTTVHGAINFDSENLAIETFATNTTLYGFALIQLPNGVPHDFILWADMTMEKWSANSKDLGFGFSTF